ncbi:NfeD family protein [Roseococcus pinisoli]|uniref:NfeD family protein n=1 Tax=Roseococcus pinisoli TaxID=2835040 RepID=A0ABS5Q7Y6_9PROT|nr:NfeD family protein [Roseococcus pinisoli]MBS7809787.1 NfeD family protein [Roseococcus pinisoli]
MNGLSWVVLALIALALLGLEMLVPFTVFLWMGVGAALAAVASYLGYGWGAQVLMFLVGASGSLATWYLHRGRRRERGDVSRPDRVLQGLRGTAVGDIAPVGRVRVADGSWAARSRAATAIRDGEAIIVIGHDGATLIVDRPEPARTEGAS